VIFCTNFCWNNWKFWSHLINGLKINNNTIIFMETVY
jgi:hypothetical protein